MEEWRDVVGYEGLYQVSNLGNVRSLYFGEGDNAKVLNPIIDINGYPKVGVSKNKTRKLVFVHRLVAEAFIPKEDGKQYVNHKDENVTNNNVSNLEWCDRSYNFLYSLNRHPERRKMMGECFKNKKTGEATSSFATKGVPHYRKEKVCQKNMDGSIVAYYNNVAEASKITHIGNSKIHRVCRKNKNGTRKDGKPFSTENYIWEYVT